MVTGGEAMPTEIPPQVLDTGGTRLSTVSIFEQPD